MISLEGRNSRVAGIYACKLELIKSHNITIAALIPHFIRTKNGQAGRCQGPERVAASPISHLVLGLFSV